MIPRVLLVGALCCAASFGFAADTPVAGLGGKDATTFRPGPPEAAARYASADWQSHWGDEFDVDGLLNPERWTYEYGLLRNNELQFYTRERPENARIEQGCLIITARRETWEKAGYTSASITSRGKFHLTYGKVEIRAKIPTGRGAWPALWMLGDTKKYGWPRSGEIDLMENVGFDPQRIHFTTHTGAFNHVQGTQRGTAVTLEAPWREFHRYGLIWTPQKLEYFLDGEKVSEFVNDGQGHDHWPFDEPHHLIMNLAIGGGWGGQKGVDDSIFPLQFEIDYVRVWKGR